MTSTTLTLPYPLLPKSYPDPTLTLTLSCTGVPSLGPRAAPYLQIWKSNELQFSSRVQKTGGGEKGRAYWANRTHLNRTNWMY